METTSNSRILRDNKTQKVLIVIRLLRQQPMSCYDIAAKIDVHPRSVYRYIRELRDAGYVIVGKGGQHGYVELMSEPTK